MDSILLSRLAYITHQKKPEIICLLKWLWGALLQVFSLGAEACAWHDLDLIDFTQVLDPISFWALHTVGRSPLSACGTDGPTWSIRAEGCLVPFSRRQQDQLHTVSQPHLKFCELDFIILAFQVRKLRLRKGQWFEPVSSLIPELCSLSLPVHHTEPGWEPCISWIWLVFFVLKYSVSFMSLYVCLSCHFLFFLKFLTSQPGIEKPRAI